MIGGNDCVTRDLNFKLFLPTRAKRRAELAVATMPPQLFHVPGKSSFSDPGVWPQQDGVDTH